MSLEAKIDALITSVDALTAVMKSGMSGKTTAAAKDDDGEKGRASSSKDDEAEKPKTTRAPRGSAKKDKVPSTADLKKAAESFLDKAGNDEDDYNERRAHLKKVVAKYDAPRFTEIAEDDRAAAIAMLNDFDKGSDDEGGRGKDEDDDI